MTVVEQSVVGKGIVHDALLLDFYDESLGSAVSCWIAEE
jgi:hypothetical protein